MPAKGRSTRTKDQVQVKKADYLARVVRYLEEYPRFLVVTCDNIGSKHMQEIRLSLRPSGSVLLMGKNTLMRKAIRMKLEEHPEWNEIIPALKTNIGLVLTKGSLSDLKDKLLESTVPAVAKAGVVAPEDVLLPRQVTALEPTKTNFFAALDIATKITRGCVEILNDVKLCDKGKKVGSSEAALLQMLDIKPFTYGLKVVNCWDGCLFPPPFLLYTKENLFTSISTGISNVAAFSLGLSYPTLPALNHVVSTGFRNLVAVSLEINYTFKEMEQIKHRIENPDAFAPTVSSTVTSTTTTVVPVVQVVEDTAPVADVEEDEGLQMDDFF